MEITFLFCFLTNGYCQLWIIFLKEKVGICSLSLGLGMRQTFIMYLDTNTAYSVIYFTVISSLPLPEKLRKRNWYFVITHQVSKVHGMICYHSKSLLFTISKTFLTICNNRKFIFHEFDMTAIRERTAWAILNNKLLFPWINKYKIEIYYF